MKKTKNSFDWHYTRWGGITAVIIIKIWLRIFRKTDYIFNIKEPINDKQPTVIASNHQSLLDPPAVFAALKFNDLIKMSPVKFMTWHKYYNSIFKLPLYTTGCYPTHGEGLTGVKGGIHYAKNGYRSFVFPEGKRTNPNNRGKAYPGISQILENLPNARLILVYIDWEPKRTMFSRPKLVVHYVDAPKNLDRSNPEAIMDAIYNLK